ncbi:DNA mismatch repair protein MutS [Sphingomonas sp. 36D10-4-7]|uniref:DNA mismatch repair protein MutS n=2 Tax=Sphingomonas corticis TaxID=2722791 RepID=A0ABX1CMW1_9SPHN|nr:Smr/MutS family protein [Sphingomonas corticis]NJR79320.1 DNA mismatch repair protein MutS [Sphingomonas corticis]
MAAPRRPLSPDEAALWQRVSASVRALPGRIAAPSAGEVPPAAPGTPRLAVTRAPAAAVPLSRPSPRGPGDTLDRSWDRRLATGGVIPDRTIDLHGHTLSSAHAALDAGLDRAIRAGDRVVLLVTGRPPRAESERPHTRGAIRAAIGDWLMLSRHAGRIAALRHAHPRHGGQGALYVILRRARD